MWRVRSGYRPIMTETAALPTPRGPLSGAVADTLRGHRPVAAVVDVEAGGRGDEQLALWMLYELHYRGFAEVPDQLEWDPDVLRLRRRLEVVLEERLRARFPGHRPGTGTDLGTALLDYVEQHEGPALSPFVQRRADRSQVLTLLRHRSLYHLKEFDPTAWVIPRLPAAPQAALLELAFDEYGCGDPNRLHSHLFAEGLAAVGLDPTPAAYVDEAPVEVLEQNNAMSLLGLHRRLRGAALGHLAAFEASSSIPSRRIAMGFQRLELPQALVDYYLEHVAADAVHEQLAARSICAVLLEQEPALTEDVWFGAFTCLDLESRYASRMLASWQDGQEQTA